MFRSSRIRNLLTLTAIAASLCLPSQGASLPSEKDRRISNPPAALKSIGWPRLYKYSKYFNAKTYDVHILGTTEVSDEKMLLVAEFIDNMISALKSPQDRAKFAGHHICLIGNKDPDLGELGSIPNQRNAGGKNVTLLTADLINHIARDDQGNEFFRAWNIPAHEFGHTIEMKLELQKRSDQVFSSNVGNYNLKMKREYFAWASETWFNSSRSKVTRDKMPKWQYDYLATIFDAANKWVPASVSQQGQAVLPIKRN